MLDTGTLYTTSEVAEFLRMSPRTVEAWRQRGEGPPFLTFGARNVRYPERWLAQWLNEYQQQETEGSD